MDEFFDPVCPCKTRCIMCHDVLNYMLDMKSCEKTVGGNVVTLWFICILLPLTYSMLVKIISQFGSTAVVFTSYITQSIIMGTM